MQTKDLIQFHVRLISLISFSSVPIHVVYNSTKLVAYHANYRKLLFLKTLQFVHTAYYGFKGFVLLQKYTLLGETLTGNGLVQIAFWLVPAIIGFLLPALLRSHGNEISLVSNHVLTLEHAKNSILLKFLLLAIPVACTGVSVLYAALLIIFDTNKSSTNAAGLNIFRVFINAFDIWDFCYVAYTGCFAIYIGMFGSYLTLYNLSVHLRRDMINFPDKPQLHLNKVIGCYKQLQLYAKLVNYCFQHALALPVKVVLLTLAILLATVALNERLRSSSATEVLVLGEFTLLNLYVLLAIGYSFPGMLNTNSKVILQKWQTIVSTGFTGKSRLLVLKREMSRIIKACAPVKVGIGSSNYYEKQTALVIMRFLIDSTVNLVLLIK